MFWGDVEALAGFGFFSTGCSLDSGNKPGSFSADHEITKENLFGL